MGGEKRRGGGRGDLQRIRNGTIPVMKKKKATGASQKNGRHAGEGGVFDLDESICPMPHKKEKNKGKDIR